MTKELFELSGCMNCVQLLANGEFPPDNTPEQDAALEVAIEMQWPSAEWHVVVAGDENSENEFSWRPCDVCGSTLGGDRYPCAAFKCD